jgi:DNA-binding SARP family transcriptional activator
VTFDTRKATALLAHLALEQRPRSREALCMLLWPGQDLEHARGALRRTLSAVRKGIGEEWIDAATDSVALRDGAGLAVDVRRFRGLAAGEATATDLLAAVELFRGELLEGFFLRDSPEFEAWYVYEADALQRELGAALGRLVRLLIEQGAYDEAIPHARRWLGLDQLHEPAHRELIRLYALTGDRAAALAQYRDCVRTLSLELGVGPVDETAALFEQVSEGTLVAPAPAPPGAAGGLPARAAEELPLVGRAADLAALLEAHDQARRDGHLVVIEGEGGIGKTRLAREFTATVAERGGIVLAARCHDDEAGLPYGPVMELLRAALSATGDALPVSPQRIADASVLVPDLAAACDELPSPVSLTAPGARTRLFEAVAAVLSVAAGGPVPGVVFVDDVHAADEATLDVLVYLGRRLRATPLVLVLAWQGEAVPPGHRLRKLATESARAGGATIVSLSRLGEDDVALLMAPELAHRIYLESEGLPLFVTEYLAAGEPAEGALPAGLRDLLDARVSGLGAIARQVLETAAVVGREFEHDTVRAASGRSDEEAVDGLEELVGRGLLREVGARYDFTHGKLREFAYESISLARRRLLHRRVADALLRAATGADTASPAAVHLQLAGDDAGAAEQHRVAAEHAASLLAHRDALDHLDAALALGHPDVAGLHERIGDLRTLVGDYAGALAGYESAAATCEPGSVAGIEHKLGGVHARRGEWDRAGARFTVALEALGDGDAGLRARILADLSLCQHRLGQRDRAAALAEEGRALAESAADERAETQAHNLLGVLARQAGRLADARTSLERSLAVAEQLGDPSARAAALNNLALVARDAGDLDRALSLTEEALALCAAEGDRHREAALENNLADLHHAAGRDDESMAHLKRAVTIFAEIGSDEPTDLPEVWKLVSW